jgi:hypothetical protein
MKRLLLMVLLAAFAMPMGLLALPLAAATPAAAHGHGGGHHGGHGG